MHKREILPSRRERNALPQILLSGAPNALEGSETRQQIIHAREWGLKCSTRVFLPSTHQISTSTSSQAPKIGSEKFDPKQGWVKFLSKKFFRIDCGRVLGEI